MKIFLLIVLNFYINPSFAVLEIGLHLDKHGKLIRPDEILLQNAVNADKKGFQESALKKYKRSAEFGNKKSMYIITMHYFQNSDWVNGYAWLRLINGNYKDTKAMKKNIESLITDSELIQSNKQLLKLKQKYSPITALERREKWDKSIKLTGSHMGGIRDTNNLKIYTSVIFTSHGFSNTGVVVTERQLFNEIQKFKYEYEEIKTEIKMGDIVPIGD